MKVFPLAMVLALLAGPAFAQGVNLMPQDKRLTSEEIERNKAIDEAYRSTIRKMPDQKTSSDPWGNVRSAGTSQPTQGAPAKGTSQKTSKTQVKPKPGN